MKYSVSKNKVVAVMEDTKYDAVDFLLANVPEIVVKGRLKKGKEKFPDIVLYDDEDMAKMLMKNTYKGVAKCHPGDVFDVEVGKQLARKRVLKKHDKDMLKICEPILKEKKHRIEVAERKLGKKRARVANSAFIK